MSTRSSVLLLAAIDDAVLEVQERIALLKITLSSSKDMEPSGADDEMLSRLDTLGEFLNRLKQIKDWLQEDDNLLMIVDAHISQQAKKAERLRTRNELRLTIITTIVGALLGWLLSAVASPLALLSLLFHH